MSGSTITWPLCVDDSYNRAASYCRRKRFVWSTSYKGKTQEQQATEAIIKEVSSWTTFRRWRDCYLNSGKLVNFYKTQKNHIHTGQLKYTPFDTHCSSSPTTYFPPISHILSFYLHYSSALFVFVVYHIIVSLSHIASTFPYYLAPSFHTCHILPPHSLTSKCSGYPVISFLFWTFFHCWGLRCSTFYFGFCPYDLLVCLVWWQYYKVFPFIECAALRLHVADSTYRNHDKCTLVLTSLFSQIFHGFRKFISFYLFYPLINMNIFLVCIPTPMGAVQSLFVWWTLR